MIPLPDWLKVIQLKPRFLFGLRLVGTLLLFLPDGFAGSLGIKTIRENYRGWIGIGTLAAFAFWLVQLIPEYKTARNTNKRRDEVIRSISSLSSDERFLFAFCLNRNQQIVTLEITHRIAGALVAQNMIMASGVGNQLAWPFTVPDFLWQHIVANPQSIYAGMDPNDPQLQAAFQRLESHIHRWD